MIAKFKPNWFDTMKVLSEHSYYRGAALDGFKSQVIDRYGVEVWNTEAGTYDRGSKLTVV